MKKSAIIILTVFAVFLLTVSAFFLGRNTVRGVKVRTERVLPEQTEQVRAMTVTEAELININLATVEQLQELPQIGEVIAQRIVDYRTEHGAFSATSELMNVEGIGKVRFDLIKDYVTVR